MAVEPDALPEPHPGLQRVHSEYRKLTVDWADGFPYEGASLKSSDFSYLKMNLDENANLKYWKPSDPNIMCSVESALERRLEECSNGLEALLDENTMYKNRLAEKEGNCWTIGHAYTGSTSIGGNLEYCIDTGLLHNEALLDSFGDYIFQDLGICYCRTNIYMETRAAFSTPGYPHVTIFSIQPQRALSEKDLLYTEVWTLNYWAQKEFAQRTLRKAQQSLPMRLVSLCGHEARIISAVYSADYLHLMMDEPRKVKFRNVKCQIHIAEYRDLGNPQHFRELMAELVATPCGNTKM